MTITRNIMPLLAAFIVAASATLFATGARAESAVSVLCYHSFLDKKKMDPFSFTVDELNSQITQLKKEGFRFVSISDVVTGRISGTKNVLITIDDGNRSVYEAYRRVFKPNGIRPLLGIYPNIIINKKHYALTWEQLQELANGGCDIAAHGYFHLKINKKLNDKNPGYFKKEIFLVKKVLEEKLNRKVTAFIYPFGLRDDMTIRALKEAGYRYAFTINNGRIDIPLANGGDRPFELPRYMVTRTNWKYCFNSVVKNARHKTSYRVAAADGPSMDKADTPAGRTAAERPDPAAELQARLTERMDRTAMTDIKAEKKDKLAKEAGAKKKIEKKTGIGPDTGTKDSRTSETVPAGREKPVFPPEDSAPSRAAPIQKVASSVKRDSLDLDRRSLMTDEKRHASVFSLDPGSPVKSAAAAGGTRERDESPAALDARVPKETRQYLSKMKDQYHGINAKSLRTYRGLLGLVNGKIDRIKHTIRKYVLGNF